jgi:ankyrin repeat protein
MGRLDPLPQLANALLAASLLIGAWTANAAQSASDLQSAPATDALEPAKAAIRVKDYDAAAHLLSEQAARDNAQAQYLLGAMALADLVPGTDRGRAHGLFEAAAAHGNPRAAFALAALHATSDPQDPAGAKRWLERAAELGDPVARDMVQRGVLPLEARPQDFLTDEASRRVALWRAARRGDVAMLETLATPERVTAADEFGRTALHHAADAGAASAVSVLLDRGAKVDATDQYGITPLMLACGAEPADSCARLLKAGASVTAADSAGNTALAYAVRRGRTQQAKDLRVAGAAPVRVSEVASAAGPMDHLSRAVSDAYAGWPDVVVAASRKDPQRLRELLSRGGDPNSATPGGESALMVAVAADSAQAASLLLTAGADASRAGQDSMTPLGLAVRLGHDSVVEVLLKHGARPVSPVAGEPPLVVAVGRGDTDVVRALLAAGADAGVKTRQGATSLMIAAGRDQVEIAKLLIDARASASTVDSAGRSALWLAACGDSAPMVSVLLTAGAAVDSADLEGVTPLSCAAARGYTAIVDQLLRAGASVSSKTRNGDTPLTLAAAGGHASTTRRLLTAGADANVQNRLGDTALILASQSGDLETVRALLDGGASRKLRNRDGIAASDAARARSLESVVALLDR